MISFDYDLRYLKAGIDSLESYLLSDHLYWTLDVRELAGEPAFPNLTLGSLLLAKVRLQARCQTSEQQIQLDVLLTRLEYVQMRWRSAWIKKANRSLHSRLYLWRDFLDDYRRMPEANADRYAYEVRRRVMIELLQAEMDHLSLADRELLAKLDVFVETFLVRGEFIWSQDLTRGFPAECYWYLYGRLPVELKFPENY